MITMTRNKIECGKLHARNYLFVYAKLTKFISWELRMKNISQTQIDYAKKIPRVTYILIEQIAIVENVF